MQVTISTVAAGGASLTKPPATVLPKALAAPSTIEALDSVGLKQIDFSKITPRQLHAFLDETVMSGKIDATEMLHCSTLFCAIPGEWYTEQPDVPLDLTATVASMADFARDNHSSSLARSYDDLLDWMKLMEARSARLSVMA